MKKTKCAASFALLLTMAGFLTPVAVQARGKSLRLPPAAAKVIKANFPSARIRSVGRERERGAWYYEVALRDGKRRFEVEVTAEGVIGEIEAKIKFSDIPGDLAAVIRKRIGNGKVARVEKHERRGIARNGKFVPLKKPRIMYEVKYYDVNGRRREMSVASNRILELPKAAKAKIKMYFPGARIVEVEMEDDDGVMIYAVQLQDGEGRKEVDLLADGRVLEEEKPWPKKAMPKPIWKKLAADDVLRNADKPSLSRRETWGVVEDGKVVGRKYVTYVVRIRRGGHLCEYRFDGRGKLINKPQWEPVDEEDDEEDDED